MERQILSKTAVGKGRVDIKLGVRGEFHGDIYIAFCFPNRSIEEFVGKIVRAKVFYEGEDKGAWGVNIHTKDFNGGAKESSFPISFECREDSVISIVADEPAEFRDEVIIVVLLRGKFMEGA